MKKELILKYKSEFDSWLKDEKSIIMGYNKSKTLDIEIEWLGFIDWTFDRGIYIMDDEYVELRKALAEGKTVQLNEAEKFADSNRGWVDLSCISLGDSINVFPVNYYRIKPEEPPIKIGDYLYDIPYHKYHRIENILDEKVETKSFRVWKSSINDYDYRLWKPKASELVVMYSEDYSTGFTVTLWEENSKFIPVPFTGELPE